MATLRKRTRGRLLTIFTVVAVIFSMGGAVPAEESGEPSDSGIDPAADTNVTGNLFVQDDALIGYSGDPAGTGYGTPVELTVHETSGVWPEIRLDNGGASDPTHTLQRWDLQSQDDAFGVHAFEIQDVETGNDVLTLEPGAPNHSLYVESDGDLRVVNRLGIGTVNPIEDIEITSGVPGVLYRDNAPSFWWQELADAGYYAIYNQFAPPTGLPNAGIFEIDPQAPVGALNMKLGFNDMSQSLRVTGSPGAVIPTLRLEKAGAPLLFYTNTATGHSFQFSLLANGEFAISALGTGGPELVVAPNGTVRMGPGASSTFILDPAGNLTITGNLTTAGGTLSASDAALQAQVEALQEQVAALEALVASLTG